MWYSLLLRWKPTLQMFLPFPLDGKPRAQMFLPFSRWWKPQTQMFLPFPLWWKPWTQMFLPFSLWWKPRMQMFCPFHYDENLLCKCFCALHNIGNMYRVAFINKVLHSTNLIRLNSIPFIYLFRLMCCSNHFRKVSEGISNDIQTIFPLDDSNFIIT